MIPGNCTLMIVEDDPALRQVVHVLAEAHGFQPILADTCETGIRQASALKPDAAIVDLGLPDRDGIHFVKHMRTWSNIPILVLSARTDELHCLGAFEAGADDFVTKPFKAPELFARIKALLRRTAACEAAPDAIAVGGISIDVDKRCARRWDGAAVRLTPLEHRILEILAQNADRVVMHERLLHEVWGSNHADMRSLRVYMMSLRRKLEREPCRPRHILTEAGVGYRLALEAPPP